MADEKEGFSRRRGRRKEIPHPFAGFRVRAVQPVGHGPSISDEVQSPREGGPLLFRQIGLGLRALQYFLRAVNRTRRGQQLPENRGPFRRGQFGRLESTERHQRLVEPALLIKGISSSRGHRGVGGRGQGQPLQIGPPPAPCHNRAAG